MTPKGRAEVTDSTEAAVRCSLFGGGDSIWYSRAELTPLIPDTGLERRVRELTSRLADTSDQPKRSSFMRGWNAGAKHASEEILALLDTPEAEPEEPAKPEPHDGWITHDGEPLTFADDVWLEAELRDGKRVAALASNVSWMHHGELDDVVRYRALPNLFEEPPDEPEPPPDAGLEERLRKWATTKFCHLTAETGAGFRAAQSDVLTILGAPRAKPEPEPEPPPNAGVTREEPTLRERFAMAAMAGLLANSSDDHVAWQQVPSDIAVRAIKYADETIRRLRREEERDNG